MGNGGEGGRGDLPAPKTYSGQFVQLTDKQKAELRALEALPDDQIDTSDMPEVRDWSKARRGLFCIHERRRGRFAARDVDGPSQCRRERGRRVDRACSAVPRPCRHGTPEAGGAWHHRAGYEGRRGVGAAPRLIHLRAVRTNVVVSVLLLGDAAQGWGGRGAWQSGRATPLAHAQTTGSRAGLA